MDVNRNAVIIGVGHVGKRHALRLSKIFKKLYIIDPNENSLNWCKDNIDNKILLFNNFSEFSFENTSESTSSVAVISNWGIDHHTAFFNSVNKKINKIYMEKPFSHSLSKINDISEYVLKNNINLVSGFQLRHSQLGDVIKSICNK